MTIDRNELMMLINQAGGIEITAPDQDIYDLGLSSFAMLPVLTDIEDRYKITLSEDRFLKARTVESIATLVESMSA